MNRRTADVHVDLFSSLGMLYGAALHSQGFQTQGLFTRLLCPCRLVATPTSEQSSSVFSVVYALSLEQQPFATVSLGVLVLDEQGSYMFCICTVTL